jgi:hypothetical protein
MCEISFLDEFDLSDYNNKKPTPQLSPDPFLSIRNATYPSPRKLASTELKTLVAYRCEKEISGNLQYEWGGTEPPKFTAGIAGKLNDTNGNNLNLNIERNTTGRNSASIHAGHKDQWMKEDFPKSK